MSSHLGSFAFAVASLKNALLLDICLAQSHSTQVFAQCVQKSLSCVRLSAALWTVARQAPLSMEYSRPRLTKVLHFRGSQVDALDLVSIWQECVNASTFFLAKDYLEAKRLVELGIDV